MSSDDDDNPFHGLYQFFAGSGNDGTPSIPVSDPPAKNSSAPTSYTPAQVKGLVDEANGFATDLYNRYVVTPGGHTAAEKAKDLARAQQLQGQLSQMLQGALPQSTATGQNYENNIHGASDYLLHAAVNSGIGWHVQIPEAAGGAAFGFDNNELPDSGLVPPQKIGPLY